MPRILFRADAQETIGVGDLMSLVYLSRQFREHSWSSFFAVRNYAPARKIAKQFELENIHIIPKDASLEEEIMLIKKICVDSNIDCMFLEITKESLLKYKTLGRPAPIKACVNFDGIITGDFDIVVNWCVDTRERLYEKHKCPKTKFILGFENAILPHYFSEKHFLVKKEKDTAEKILISMGGVDEFNLTAEVLKALSGHDKASGFDIRAIVGPGYAHSKDLLDSLKGNVRGFTVKENCDNLSDDYMWADMAFSAGGLTSSELVAAKIPSILIAAYGHQVKRCEYYFRQNWVYYAGYRDIADEKRIRESLDYLTNNIGLFRDNLSRSGFRGGNEKIYKNIDTCRQSKQLD